MSEPLQGLFWSKADAEKALGKHTFIRVSPSEKRSTRQMTGAERVWSLSETKDEIYLITFRISGKKGDVQTSLINAGYSPETVSTALSDAVTSENYKTTKKEAYDREIEKLKIFKQEEKERKKQQEIDWGTLLQIASNTKQAHIVMKERGASPKKTGRGKTLLDRFEEVRYLEGKMIDVTDMRDDGTGIKIQSKPTTERGQKVFLPSIPIMSKNQEKYLRALEMLFHGEKFDSETEYQKAINAAQAKFSKKHKSK